MPRQERLRSLSDDALEAEFVTLGSDALCASGEQETMRTHLALCRVLLEMGRRKWHVPDTWPTEPALPPSFGGAIDF